MPSTYRQSHIWNDQYLSATFTHLGKVQVVKMLIKSLLTIISSYITTAVKLKYSALLLRYPAVQKLGATLAGVAGNKSMVLHTQPAISTSSNSAFFTQS
jgi:hypothetical protein